MKFHFHQYILLYLGSKHCGNTSYHFLMSIYLVTTIVFKGSWFRPKLIKTCHVFSNHLQSESNQHHNSLHRNTKFGLTSNKLFSKNIPSILLLNNLLFVLLPFILGSMVPYAKIGIFEINNGEWILYRNRPSSAEIGVF